jgi:protein TonB
LGPSFFKDVLLGVDPGDRKRRRWAATSSVIFQSLLLGVALILPLMFTEALPKAQLLTFLEVPPPPPPPPPASAAEPVKVVKRLETDIMDGRLRSPARIPQTVQMIKEEEAPPPLMTGGGVIGGVPGGVPGGQLGGVIGGIVSATSNLAAVPKLAKPTVQRVRISQGVTKGMVTYKPEPVYPVLARNARIQGDVVLTAVISAEGQITQLKVLSGHALLVQAALDAVKQWRYRPFLLNGQPIEVETTVTVSFRFSA